MITVAFAICVGLSIFLLVWGYVTKGTIKRYGISAAMTFTPDDGRGGTVTFEPRHERYMKIAEVVTTLASASLIFIPKSRLSVYTHSCAFALIILGFSVLYNIGFMAALTYFYEGFLYDRNSYKPWKYGLVHGLGFGGLFCFALAYIFLAVRVGWSVVYVSGPTTPTQLFPQNLW
jgi:hypothetical protein